MRSYIFLLACLSLIACAWGNNLILGRRIPGDLLLKDEPIVKFPVPGVSQVATVNVTAPPGYVISFISVTNLNPKVVTVKPVKGFLGTPSVVLAAFGRPSWGLVMKVVVFAVPSKHPTSTTSTVSTSTTRKSSTQPTSTRGSTEPTSTESSSTEPTSVEPSSTEPTPDVPSSTEPTSDEPTSDEPTSDEPTSDEPTSDEPTSDEPTSDEPSWTETTQSVEV